MELRGCRWWTPWAYLIVPLGLLGVFFFLPVVMAFGMSLLDYRQSLVSPEWVGFQNYLDLLQNTHFATVLWNTLMFMLLVVPAMIVLPMPVALLINQPLRGMSWVRALAYLPVVVPLVVAGIAWRWLYQSDGLVNYGLSLLGLPKVDWLVSPDIALVAVAVMVIWKGVGYYMMMYLANLQSLSHELYEAADIDGASLWQKQWHITLPHLRPAMAMVAIISVIGALKTFTEIYVMTRGGPVGATETFVYYIYDQAFGNLNLGVACAAGFLLMLVILGLSLINIRFFYLKAEQEALHA